MDTQDMLTGAARGAPSLNGAAFRFVVPGQPQGKGRVSLNLVRECIAVDFETGKLQWRVDRGQRARAGRTAGCLHVQGYWSVGLAGVRNIAAHRIVWALAHGDWPDLEVDHIDGVRTNNALRNLRLVTAAENHQNMRRARSDNGTGTLGVCRRGTRFRAQIQVGGKKRWLGEFDTIEQASCAYIQAKRALHPKGML